MAWTHGIELYESLFEDLEPYEIEDHDEVTCYEENLGWVDGWYIITNVSFRYRGNKYMFERKDHSSDNVGDTHYNLETFCMVIERDEMSAEINKIIKGIEEETYSTWENIVEDLEGLKKLAEKMNQ